MFVLDLGFVSVCVSSCSSYTSRKKIFKRGSIRLITAVLEPR